MSRFYTCPKHGWDCWGKRCPKCESGDSPMQCRKHGWSSSVNGCPYCSGDQKYYLPVPNEDFFDTD